MAEIRNIFDKEVTEEIIGRINRLESNTPALWGTMNTGQMLAHCNVTYELVYEGIYPQPNAFKRMILTWIVKNAVVNEKPFKKSGPTGPEFKIRENRDFALEKGRLIKYLQKTLELGQAHFEGKESHSFGALTASEWNNMFYKHIDHHLRQFGI